MTDKNNSMAFIKSDVFLDNLKASVDWGGKMMTRKDQQAAQKIEVVLNKLIYPVMDGFKMYQTIGTRIVFKESVIEIDSRYQIEKMTLNET